MRLISALERRGPVGFKHKRVSREILLGAVRRPKGQAITVVGNPGIDAVLST